MGEDKVDQFVESICEQGCSHVNHVIELLEQQQVLTELDVLNLVEKNILLQELRSIMAVYDGECSAPVSRNQLITLPIYPHYNAFLSKN